VAVDVTDIVDNVSITEVATNNIQRAALTGAISASAGSNSTLFSGITDNGVSEADRATLNFQNSTTNTALITDSGSELQIEYRRAALTGAIAASANSNATTFAGILDNGAAENNRTNLNFLNSTSCTAVVTDDSGNDELEITFQRAALTGAVAASANSNATVFSGIRDNGSSESDRSNLNFVSGTNTTATVTDDSGNDELEIRVNVDDYPLSGLADQAANTIVANATGSSAAPTALVISGDSLPARVGGNLVSHPFATLAGFGLTYASGAIDVDEDEDYTWTGTHTFPGFIVTGGSQFQSTVEFANSGRILFNSVDDEATAGTLNDHAVLNVSVVRYSAATTITGIDNGAAGRFLILVNDTSSSISIIKESGSSAAENRFAGPGSSRLLGPHEAAFAWYDGTSSRWRLMSGMP